MVRAGTSRPASTPKPGSSPRINRGSFRPVRSRSIRYWPGGNAWNTAVPELSARALHTLPPGQYRIDLDLTGLKEPLLIRGELPGFGVEAGREVPALTIPLYPRPIRFSPQRPGGPG